MVKVDFKEGIVNCSDPECNKFLIIFLFKIKDKYNQKTYQNFCFCNKNKYLKIERKKTINNK